MEGDYVTFWTQLKQKVNNKVIIINNPFTIRCNSLLSFFSNSQQIFFQNDKPRSSSDVLGLLELQNIKCSLTEELRTSNNS